MHGHLRVPGVERPVRAAAQVVTAAEVRELPARGSGHEHLAGIGVRESPPRPLEPVRVIQESGVAVQLPAVGGGREAELLARAARDRGPVLPEQGHLDGRDSVEPPSQGALVVAPAQPVHLPGPVGSRDEDPVDPGEGGLQARHALHGRLPVIAADDEGVPLEEGVQPAGGLYQRAERGVAASQCRVRRVRPFDVGGVVVVREVEEQEVEAVARHQPAADGRRVVVDRAGGAVQPSARRPRRVGLEEVVEEELPRGSHRAAEQRHARRVRRAAPVARDVDRGGHEPRVVERLVHGHGTPAEVLGVQVHDRVADRLPRPCRAHGAERRAVLDDAALAAVIPDEVRNLMHVRAGACGDRRQAHRRQRREDRDGAAVGAELGEPRQPGRRGRPEGGLEHRRGQAVDDGEDELARHFASVRRPA
jgi:hypothetical protein